MQGGCAITGSNLKRCKPGMVGLLAGYGTPLQGAGVVSDRPMFSTGPRARLLKVVHCGVLGFVCQGESAAGVASAPAPSVPVTKSPSPGVKLSVKAGDDE